MRTDKGQKLISPAKLEYLRRTVLPIEKALLDLSLGKLFTGQLFDEEDEPISGLFLPDMGQQGTTLTAAEVGRLFMAHDFSIISFRRLAERDDGTPAGLHVFSTNDFVQPDEQVDVVAYKDVHGNGVRIDALNLSRVMLNDDAPERLCTVAFSLLACTAYRKAFDEVTLFAAGRGYGGSPLDKDDLVGYQVWPKFGFDAPLVPADLNRYPQLAKCCSVQDVHAIDAKWWEANGRGTEMRFDLSADSRSWRVLLNYLRTKFAKEWR
jgi:hypothetical protein